MGETASKRIALKPSTKKKMGELIEKGETYDSFINELIDFSKEFADEREFHEWVVDNHELLGFEDIIGSNFKSFPDLVVDDFNGERLRVELEVKSSNFLKHNHDSDKVDIILCLVRNKDIEGVEVEEIKPFREEWGKSEERGGKYTARIEFRVEPFIKELIEEFAEQTGQTESKVGRKLINDAIDQFGGGMRVKSKAIEKRIEAKQEEFNRLKSEVDSMKEEWEEITDKSWEKRED